MKIYSRITAGFPVINPQNSRHAALKCLNRDVFQKSVSFKCSEPKDENENETREFMFRDYMDFLFFDSKMKNIMNRRKNEEITRFNQGFEGYSYFEDNLDFLNNALINANLNNVFSVCNYLRIYYSNNETPRVFLGQDIEALEIFAKLDNKDDLSKYPELLLYLYNQSEDKKNFNPNETIKFLKNIGLTDFKNFNSCFSHLKNEFNNFEKISDKADAVEYLQLTYNEKIKFINDSLSASNKLKNTNSAQFYFKNYKFIDFLYEKNGAESLSPLNLIIDNLIEMQKVKSSRLRYFASSFNEFKSQEDYLSFFKFLAENGISADRLNETPSAGIISDENKIESFFNKDILVNEIMKAENCRQSKAVNTYKLFSGLYNTVYNSGKSDGIGIKTLSSIISNFKIQNNNDMLKLFNKINRSNEKSITREQFIKFIELMTFCESNEIFTIAGKQNLTPKELLEQEKQKFSCIEEKLKAFIESDDSYFFAGIEPLEIYQKYKKAINDNPDDINSILKEIAVFKIKNDGEYFNKSEKIKKLEKFFPDKKQLILFIKNSGIKFNSSEDDDKFIDTCSKILSFLSKEEINYYINSKFFAASKSVLDKFRQSYPYEKEQKRIFSVIAKKSVPSLKDFDAFMSAYADNSGKCSNVLAALENLPYNIQFKDLLWILTETEETLKNLNINSLKINNSNIAEIDIEALLKSRPVTNYNLAEVLNNISGARDNENFILKLPSAIVQYAKTFSKFKISNEIELQLYKDRQSNNKDSYKNIMQILNLPPFDEKHSYYFYTNKIEKIIPQEFIDLVNDVSWQKVNGIIPSISLHARMRLIERFVLENENCAKNLYSKETKEYMNSIIKAVYCAAPSYTKGIEDIERIAAETKFEGKTIKSIFSKNGTMISIMAKS